MIGRILRFGIERMAGRASLDTLGQKLADSTEATAARIAGAADTPANRKVARHVIGIERWSARRLRCLASGDMTVVFDEYDAYQPPEGLLMPALAQAFRETRADILSLVEPLRAARERRVTHNQIGPLDARGWLVYVQSHTDAELRKLR